MHTPRFTRILVLLAVAAAMPLAAQAQTQHSVKLTPTGDRLFASFIEDATIVDNQWWEGRLSYEDFDSFKVTTLRGYAAFQPWRDWEVGATVGFGDTDVSGSGSLDGNGATDLEAWGKYYLGIVGDNAEFVVGGKATVPTGDDSVGLGYDAFALAGFGSMRYRLRNLVITADAGLQFNDDGRIFGVDLDGKTSPFVGGGVIVPLSDEVTFVGELRYAGKRFNGMDSEGTLLGGVNLRVFNRGMLRGAVGVGVSDGSPDLLVTAGYAANF